jgi:hypothetical protein
MLIEFMGLPGVGKSTIALGVCATLRASGCRLAWAPDAFVHSQPALLRVHKLARIATYGIFHPASAAGAARRSRSFPQPSRSIAMRLMGNWLYVSAVCAMQSRSDEHVVLDQGLGQGLYSLALQSDDDWLPTVRRALMGTKCPDIVVSVEAPAAVVRERMRRRAASYSATERLLLADQHWFDKTTRILDHVRQVLAERDVQVLRCDSHAQTAQAAIDFIASAIAQRLSAGGGN